MSGRRFVLCVVVCSTAASLSHETLTTTVLFDREIVRILNRHCVMCHVESGPSFPLETYEQTWLQRPEDPRRCDRPAHAAVVGRSGLWPVRQREQPDACAKRSSSFRGWKAWDRETPARCFTTSSIRTPASRGSARAARLSDTGSSASRTCALSSCRSTIDARARTWSKTSVIDLGLTSERRVARHRIHAGRPPRRPGGVLHASGNRPVAGKLDALVRVREAAGRRRPIACRRVPHRGRDSLSRRQPAASSREARSDFPSPRTL